MKYLYTVLDRKKQGNTSFYLVKNLKTNKEKVLPISWIRKQYPKGVFSNISISEDGKVSIVKDKADLDIFGKLLKKVKIVEFLEDAKLDGLSFEQKGRYAIKEIEVLKTQFFESAILNCVQLDEDSVYFLKHTKKGEIGVEHEVVGYHVDWRFEDGLGEDTVEVHYPESMNEDTSIFFEVDKAKLKQFLLNKNINLGVKELKKLEKAILYSLLYYCHEWSCAMVMREVGDDFDSSISVFIKGKKLDEYEYLSGGLEKSDVKILYRCSRYRENLSDYFSYFTNILDKYDDLKTEGALVFYNDRVVKEDNKLKYEVYAHSGWYYDEGFSSRYDDDDREYDPFDDPRDYDYYRDMQYDG